VRCPVLIERRAELAYLEQQWGHQLDRLAALAEATEATTGGSEA
jgi:hypothetical protein